MCRNSHVFILFISVWMSVQNYALAQHQKVFKFRTHAWGSSVMEIKNRKALVTRNISNEQLESFANLQLKDGKDSTTFQPLPNYSYYIDVNERLELQKIPLQAIVYAYNANGKLTRIHIFLKSDLHSEAMKEAVDARFGKPYKEEKEEVNDHDGYRTIRRFYYKADEDTEVIYQMVKWGKNGQAAFIPYTLSNITMYSKSLTTEHEDKTSGGF
ncbi:MAG: hypothetical protein NZ519_11230 [Bacteroidia bacterium]|nr:hypothetical protein [Bacteroidia bacterium]MDW8302641.1 hypothetical protein [Bacteroidia bacterium]